jgi:hypothetical protein
MSKEDLQGWGEVTADNNLDPRKERASNMEKKNPKKLSLPYLWIYYMQFWQMQSKQISQLPVAHYNPTWEAEIRSVRIKDRPVLKTGTWETEKILTRQFLLIKRVQAHIHSTEWDMWAQNDW